MLSGCGGLWLRRLEGLVITASDGDRWIAAENITRAQAKLAQTKDEGERRALRDLIAREKEKLAVPKGEKRG